MIRGIASIIVGISASVLVVIIFPPVLPALLPSISDFIGGFFAGMVAQKRGFIYGGIVSAILFIVLVISLIFVAYKSSGGHYYFPDFITLAPNWVAIVFGAVGGYLGELIRHLTWRKVKA